MNSRAEILHAGGLLAFVVLLLALPFALAGASPVEYVLTDGDGWLYFYPAHVLLRDTLLGGNLPIWSEAMFAGFPIGADPQMAAWFLPAWILLLPLPLIGFHLKLAAYLFMALLGTSLALRHLGCGPAARWIGALTFAVGGTMMTRLAVQPSMVAVAAFLPWMALAAAHRDGPTRNWPIISLLMAGALLAGHPQVAIIVISAFGVAWTMLWMTTERNKVLGLARMAVSGVLALMIAAIQILPTRELSTLSVRPEVTLEFFSSYSFELRLLPLLLFPFLMGYYKAANWPDYGYWGPWNLNEMAANPGTLIGGALALVFVGILVRTLLRKGTSLEHPARVHGLAWAVVGGLGFLCALGTATPLGHLLYHTPPFGMFRAQSRFLIPTQLAVGLCAGLGAQWLLMRVGREDARARWMAVLPWVLLAVGAVVGLLLWAGMGGELTKGVFERHNVRPRMSRLPRLIVRHGGMWIPLVVIASGLIGAGLIARLRGARRVTLLAVLMAGVATGDALVNGFNYLPRPQKDPATLDWTAWDPGPDGRIAIAIPFDDFFRHHHGLPIPISNVIAGFNSINGHSPLAPGGLQRRLGLSVVGSADPPYQLFSEGITALQALGVTVVASPAWHVGDRLLLESDHSDTSETQRWLGTPLHLNPAEPGGLALVSQPATLSPRTFYRVEVTARRTAPPAGVPLHVDLYGRDYDHWSLELEILDSDLEEAPRVFTGAWFTGQMPEGAELRTFTRSGAGIVVESIIAYRSDIPTRTSLGLTHGGHRAGDIELWRLPQIAEARLLDATGMERAATASIEKRGRRMSAVLQGTITEGVVHVTTRYEPGWRAWAINKDGGKSRLRVVRGPHQQIEVVLEGETATEFPLDNLDLVLEYSPKSLQLGASFCIVGLLLLAALWMIESGWRRKHSTRR